MWKKIRTLEYYFGIIFLCTYFSLLAFCYVMKTGIIKISALNSADWDGAIYALSRGIIPIIILAIVLLKRRKKKQLGEVPPLLKPDKEEILRKAKQNAEKLKVSSNAKK